ncbi:MAG: LD-carboxypeptidase [Calditrichaceae bacterium]
MLKRINKGSKIGVIAPAFQPNPQKLDRGIQYLENRGFKVVRGKSLNAKYGYLAGEDYLRVDDIHEMFADPEITAIMCARGGWGCLRLLDKVDFNLIKNNYKVLIGYSDITTLQLALWNQVNLSSLSGPMVAVELSQTIDPFTENHFWGQINNPDQTYSFQFNTDITEIWNQGQAEGTLLGGCLSMVSHLLGTPFSPDYSDCILFLEDVGEEPYRIDRYLAQLRQAGIFNKINGLILGNFIEPDINIKKDAFTVKEVLKEYFENEDYPVIYNFPYGHGKMKFTFPIGTKTILNTRKNTLQVSNIFRR